MTDRGGWQDAVESELRAVGRELAVPPASDLTAAVRRRLEGEAPARRDAPAPGGGVFRRRLGWRAAVVVAAALLALLIATPQGRAVIVHVFRFAGVELRQGPGPANSPTRAALPGERQMSLGQARHRVSFPILVPTALGGPGEVVVSDGGRVVSLIYPRTPHGLVRMDEFAGRLDRAYFEKFVQVSNVTRVEVNGAEGGLWIKGPHDLVYVTRNGTPVVASARLTTGNTLIWATRQVALRLEGNLSKAAALAIASSAR
jgi:hypothetical protein